MEKITCPICNNVLQMKHQIMYIDYYCFARDDHHFTFRVRNDTIVKSRIRLSEGNVNFHLKVHYDENYSEVWVKKDNKLRINAIISQDYSNVGRLRDKIKTLLVLA